MALALFLAIGLSAGILSGLFGIGGGILIVPALVIFAGFSQHLAVGTSLAVLLPPIGLAAVLEYWRHGNVDIKAALLIAGAALGGGWIGALIANRLSGPLLKLLFGIVIALVGVLLIWRAWRELR